ncbi:putative transmembrane protein 217B isoform X2 [Monodelphis domestica]|nr:putative transmembrane protein 217B isoform X2 [Monodelphis domestica]XP_007483874.1 putative transmembrane protein 217B isoform X2 [Monodelphis domestica]XP_056674132.1 putative transmembrane protein 217B isoform X2 [Monodelphis domestica]
MFWQQKCKLNPRLGSRMAGIFTILSTIQSLILDLDQKSSFGKEPNKYSIFEDLHGLAFWTVSYKNNIIIFLSITTLLASSFLLYSVHMKLYLGLLVYIFWIVIYDITCFSILLLISKFIRHPFTSMRYYLWINQISRMILHVFWLPFVMAYAYNLHKGPYAQLSKKGLHAKQYSEITADSWSHVTLPKERKFT